MIIYPGSKVLDSPQNLCSQKPNNAQTKQSNTTGVQYNV